jgi:hypothetical protein
MDDNVELFPRVRACAPGDIRSSVVPHARVAAALAPGGSSRLGAPDRDDCGVFSAELLVRNVLLMRCLLGLAFCCGLSCEGILDNTDPVQKASALVANDALTGSVYGSQGE